MAAITHSRIFCVFACTHISGRVGFGFKYLWYKGSAFVWAITKRLIRGVATRTPSIGFSCFEVYRDWIFPCDCWLLHKCFYLFIIFLCVFLCVYFWKKLRKIQKKHIVKTINYKFKRNPELKLMWIVSEATCPFESRITPLLLSIILQ